MAISGNTENGCFSPARPTEPPKPCRPSSQSTVPLQWPSQEIVTETISLFCPSTKSSVERDAVIDSRHTYNKITREEVENLGELEKIRPWDDTRPLPPGHNESIGWIDLRVGWAPCNANKRIQFWVVEGDDNPITLKEPLCLHQNMILFGYTVVSPLAIQRETPVRETPVSYGVLFVVRQAPSRHRGCGWRRLLCGWRSRCS